MSSIPFEFLSWRANLTDNIVWNGLCHAQLGVMAHASGSCDIQYLTGRGVMKVMFCAT